MGEIVRTLRFILVYFALCGCVPEPCADPTSPEDFSACLPLCGKASITAAQCHLEKPVFPSGLFKWDYESLLEHSVTGSQARSGRWFLGETGEGMLEILAMPFAGIASTRPAPQLRASDPVPAAGSSGMSLYLRYFTGQEACVLEVASVTSWTLWDNSSENFAMPFVRASMIIGREGDCKDTLYAGVMPGLVWKTKGQITRLAHELCPPPEGDPRPERSDVPPLDCSADGHCNPHCAFDPDCTSDFNCGDRRDGVCDPDCDGDPDCECNEDGFCDPACLHDPDCGCAANGFCNADCPYDPDCRCLADGLCDSSCPEDPDCPCLEDGYCDPLCGYGDPDCLCAANGRCQCECLRSDPDCGCAADGACSSICGWLDEDCQCLSDTVCNFRCAEIDPDCGEEAP